MDRNSNGLLQLSAYKFTDQEQDEGTGLYNYDARLCDPTLGQFIMADTIVPDMFNPQSLNRYAYCLNNPLRYVDLSGHFFGDAIGSAVGAIGDAISNAGDAISNLGNSLGDVPLVGSVLEGAANIVGGAIEAVGGIVSGDSGAISSRITNMAEGAGGILYTQARDIVSGIIGNASHIVTLPRDIIGVGKIC